MAAVNLAVWNLFGAKYIGLALIAYCFLFVLTLRKQINAAYPAQAGVEYNIGSSFNWPRFNMSSKALWIVPLFVTVVFPILLMVTFGAAVFLAPDFVGQNLESLATIFEQLPTVLVCNGFLVLRYRALFVTCCGKGKLTNHSAKRLERMTGTKHNAPFSSSRLVRASAVFILLWGGLLFTYITVNSFFDWELESSSFIGRILFLQLVILVPPAVHLLFFETLTTILRGWGDKSDLR